VVASEGGLPAQPTKAFVRHCPTTPFRRSCGPQEAT
jgi:hypothetical protein